MFSNFLNNYVIAATGVTVAYVTAAASVPLTVARVHNFAGVPVAAVLDILIVAAAVVDMYSMYSPAAYVLGVLAVACVPAVAVYPHFDPL
jgi:hypothetical protein